MLVDHSPYHYGIRLLIVLILKCISEKSCYADSSVLTELIQTKTHAQDVYYQSLQALGNQPTQTALDDLQYRILAPAKQSFVEGLNAMQLPQADVIPQEDYLRNNRQFIQKLSKDLESQMDTEINRQRIRDSIQQVIKGNSKDIQALLTKYPPNTLKNNHSNPTPSTQHPVTVVPAELEKITPHEALILDGSKIPKEMEFPGPRKNP